MQFAAIPAGQKRRPDQMNTHDPQRFDRRSAGRPAIFPRARTRRSDGPDRLQRHAVPGQPEIGIDHDGSLYRLKITRQGKLILNK